MSVLLIKLKKIIYSGENIGGDLGFQFDVKGQITHVKTRISSGQHKSFDKILFQGTFAPARNATCPQCYSVAGAAHSVIGGEGSVSLPIGVNITEEDPVFHDTGSGSSNFNVQLQGSEPQTHSFNANVIASGGDKGKTATFTFIMEADVENVPEVELGNPTAGQEFHMGMSPPTMPVVQMKAKVTPAVSGLEYRFEVGDPSNGHALDYEDAPTTGYAHPTIIDSGWLASDTWSVNFGTFLYGGHVTKVKVSVRKGGKTWSSLIDRDFFILGDTLTSAARNGYINSLTTYGANVRTIAKAVALQESGGTHFWPGSGVGTASHTRYPLKEFAGAGGGYGVMQLTDPMLLSVATIWNWQRNIVTAMARLQDCYTAGKTYLNTYPAAVTDRIKRLEAYNRYNGGLADRYHWWNGTQWVKFGYIPCPGGPGHVSHGATHGYRDYNNDGAADPPENPYNIPDGPTGPNECRPRAARYADYCLTHE